MEAIDHITHKPAQVLGLEEGTIFKNGPADVCVFDPNYKWKVSINSFESTGVNSPCLTQEMTGKVTTTIANGRIIYQEQKNFIRPKAIDEE